MPRQPLLLLVEDDPALRNLYAAALRFAGFDIHAVPDGWSALHFLEQALPDVVVLDLQLPRLSGVDVYSELRAHEATQDVPIVVCTGWDRADLPGVTMLFKPCAPEELVATVRRVMQPRQREWLYVRGDQSVRVVRVGADARPERLVVYGPGQTRAEFHEGDPLGLRARQTAIERVLIAEGYVTLPLFFGDRRSGHDRRARLRGAPDRRRPAEPSH